MSGSDNSKDRPQLPELPEEPLIETHGLNIVSEANLPLRGEIREEFIERFRFYIRKRRTKSGVSNRLSRFVSEPITGALQDEIEDRTSRRIQKRLNNVSGENNE